MTLLKKLKSLVKTNTPNTQEPTPKDTPPHNQTTPEPITNPHFAHLSPITNRIKAWLDDNDWRYHHTPPDDDDASRTHHIGLGFRDDADFGWNCLMVINEKNQLVSFHGKVDMDEPVQDDYFLPLFILFHAINQSLSIGNLELNAKTGDLHARIGFDAEFTELSDRMLNTYIQALASLMHQAHEVATVVTTLYTPGDDALSILKNMGWGDDDDSDDGKNYFIPTRTAQ